MGQRANLIIVEDGDYSLRYDHWAANRLDDILFWGADYALRYFASQEEVYGDEGWLDDVWAEGGAVLDLDEKRLLWFGGEDLMYEVHLRRAYLGLQKRVWRDWDVEWAHRGIVDLAEYVGYPKEKVLAQREVSDRAVDVSLPEKKTWVKTLGSIVTAEGETKIFPLAADVENYLRNGVNLVAQCRGAAGLGRAVWHEWEEQGEFPRGGFHVAEKNRTVDFWQSRDCPNTVAELKSLWDDWDVVWHRDEFEFQAELLKGRLSLPEPDEAELVKRLRDNLLREDRTGGGVEAFLEVKNLLEEEGRSVEVSEWALKSRRVENPLETKKRIWQRINGEE